MVDASPRTNTDWWPMLTDPLRRFGTQVADFFTPASDAAKTDEAYHIEVELPGVKEGDISVELHGDTLTVKGEKRAEREEKGKSWFFSERTYGSFQRSFRLPPDVDQSKVEAHSEDGVLKLSLPKTASNENATRKINVKKAG